MEKPLNCTIKNPVNLTVGEIKVDMLCGCKVIDITFPNIMSPEENIMDFVDESHDGILKVGEIRFKNYYVASLTVKAKFRTDQTPTPRDSGGDPPKWRTCLKKVKLMPDPHSEAGSHDFFSFTNKHFRSELSNVMSLRLILQQPSPVWREFKLEDLRLFRSPGGPKTSPLPAWLLEEPKEKFQKKTVETVASSSPKGEGGQSNFSSPTENSHQILQTQTTTHNFVPKMVTALQSLLHWMRKSHPVDKGVPDLEGLSAHLQQLWALAEEVSTRQTGQTLGRFEVDGCYDINLLAYT